MGQDFSKEDLQFLPSTQEQTGDPSSDTTPSADPVDDLLEDIGKRIVRYRSGASNEFLFYSQHRTRCGAPNVNRRSYGEDELRKFEVMNDGFPLAATVDEIREFDKSMFPGKHRKLKKKKQRSRSFTEVVSEASRRLPALSRPRFVDKIITGYSSLTRKSHGKQAQYQRQLSSDQSRLSNGHLDSPASESVEELHDVLENGYEATSDDVKFCCKCGLPILFEDVKNCSVYSDDLKVICFTCQRENSSVHISAEECNLSDSVDDRNQIFTSESLKVFTESPALLLLNPAFCEGNLHVYEKNHDRFEGASETECSSQIVDSRPELYGDDSVESRLEQFVEESVDSRPELFGEDSVDSKPELSGEDSSITSGHVRKQCEELAQSTRSHGCPLFQQKIRRSRIDRPVSGDILPLRNLHKRLLSPQTEQTKRWAKNYHNLARDKQFSQAVMAKGFVKALAEQINQQGTLKQVRDEDDEVEDTTTAMSKSTSSVSSCTNDEIPINMVHTLIQAAEQQKFKECGLSSPARKSDSLGSSGSSNNGSEHNNAVHLNSCLVSDQLVSQASGLSLILTDDTLPSNNDSEISPDSEPSINSSRSSTTLSQDTKSTSPDLLAGSSVESSPTRSSSIPQSPSTALQSSCKQKPSVNCAQKPMVPQKPSDACTTSILSPSSTRLQSSAPAIAHSPYTASPPTTSQSDTSSRLLSTPVPNLPTTLSSTVPSPKSPPSPSPKPPTSLSPKSPPTPLPKSPSKSLPKPPPSPSSKPLKPNLSKSPTKSSPKSPPKHSSKSKTSPSPKKPPTKLSQTTKSLTFISPTSHPQSPSHISPTVLSPSLTPSSTSTTQTATTSPSSPPPKTPASIKPKKPLASSSSTSPNSSAFKYEIQSSDASQSERDTVQLWLSDMDSSLDSASCKDDVCLRSSSKRSSDQYRDSVFKTIYDNPTPLSAAELFDSSWSDSDSFNEGSDEDDEKDEGTSSKRVHRADASVLEHLKTKISDQGDAHLEDRKLRIAEELVQTEGDYVARLHLLHHVFYFRLDKENRQHAFLPSDTLKHMFSNTKSIFLFHNDFLLPQLKDRMENWGKDPRIGDLMKKNAPFLKLYTEYIRNFDRAMKLINQWMEKSAKFSEIIQDIQKLPECRNLSLQHHMLGPIQRVPRYELLLKDYVRHLPADAPDMNDAKDALDLVTKAASHSNEAMKKIETFHKLLDIYQSLRGVPIDFISPTREFVIQGPVTKIAARSGEKQPRQIFLFNDLVLICTQYNLLGTYSVRSQLEVDCMEIKPGTSMNIPNTFLVHGKQKAVELLDENPTGEAVGWQEKIQTVIFNYKKRKRSIKQEETRAFDQETSVPESCLGKTAPVWIQDDAATMCMLCRSSFNMVRRRHHCRACGKLICKACSKKAPLEYAHGKIERVCSTCYDVIVNKRCNSDSSDGKTSPKKKDILHVNASKGLISGYMNCSDDGGHSWQKLWVTAHRDFVLYTFRAHEDVSAIISLPLPGHEVDQLFDIPGRHHVFCLSHKKKRVWLFQADNDKRLKRWISVLSKLTHAQLPEENSRLSSQSNSSNSSSVSDSGTINNGISPSSNKRSSTHSGSQADSGYPGDSNNSLAALAADDNDHEVADRVSQCDNGEGVLNE